MVTLQNLIEFDNTVLDGITVPEGIDADCLKSVIMMRLGLCWPIYDEPEVFKNMVYSWFISHYWNIERLIKVTNTEYAPLENYDRNESFTDSHTGGTTTDDTNVNTKNLSEVINNDTSAEGHSGTTTGSTSTNSVAAYNSTTFQNDNKNEASGSNKTNSNSTGTMDQTTTTTGTDTDARHIAITHNDSVTRGGRAHGNIGVKTTQSMYAEEVELLSGYNLYYTICNWIERDLFIQVY